MQEIRDPACRETLYRKLELSSRTSTTAQSLEERLLFYLQQPQSGGEIRHLENLLLHLHCSRRQLQRVLKKLCEEGQLEKTGRGVTGWRKTEPEQQNARAGAFLCGRCISYLCFTAPTAAARRRPQPAG